MKRELVPAIMMCLLAPWVDIAAESATGLIERPVIQRIEARTFPSVFQAWGPVQNVKDTSPLHTVARHDLVWHGPQFFGLRWNNPYVGLADGFTRESIEKAKVFRQGLLKLNPNLILIAEIRYRDAHKSYLPEGYKWWLRDNQGRIVPGWDEGGFLCLDFHNPEFRSQVAKQAKAAVESGAVDGILLDWWSDDASRLALVKEVRQAIGDRALIIANANDRKTPQTAPYINGYFMECYKSNSAKDWQQIAETLAWAEKSLREPRINCLETWYHKSRDDLHLMRATTALALTHSDGYCLFSDPNPLPTPDHLHNWYPFWNKSLGRPTAKGKTVEDGTVRREFQKGTVVYNPMGNQPVSVKFPEPRISMAAGKTAKEHRLNDLDGDIYLTMTGSSSESHRGPLPPADDQLRALAAELRQRVTHLAKDIGERNVQRHPRELAKAADYLDAEFRAAGFTVKRQEYEVSGTTCSNLEVEILGTKHPEEIVVIGAHYDSVVGTPGANDNGSGVAALLALARKFAGKKPDRTLRFVAFVNEEPPYFQTEQMGSRVYAKGCRQRGERVTAMLSLETIGYYDDAPGSQKYPEPFGRLYPSTGNFIGFVGNLASADLLQRALTTFRREERFPAEGAALPEVIPGVGFSDQWSFWQEGYPGVMVTDTAMFRYPHYHQASDTVDKVDFERLARVVRGLEKVVSALASDGHGKNQPQHERGKK